MICDEGELGFFCEREEGHEPPHCGVQLNYDGRSYRLEWWDEPEPDTPDLKK